MAVRCAVGVFSLFVIAVGAQFGGVSVVWGADPRRQDPCSARIGSGTFCVDYDVLHQKADAKEKCADSEVFRQDGWPTVYSLSCVSRLLAENWAKAVSPAQDPKVVQEGLLRGTFIEGMPRLVCGERNSTPELEKCQTVAVRLGTEQTVWVVRRSSHPDDAIDVRSGARLVLVVAKRPKLARIGSVIVDDCQRNRVTALNSSRAFSAACIVARVRREDYEAILKQFPTALQQSGCSPAAQTPFPCEALEPWQSLVVYKPEPPNPECLVCPPPVNPPPPTSPGRLEGALGGAAATAAVTYMVRRRRRILPMSPNAAGETEAKPVSTVIRLRVSGD